MCTLAEAMLWSFISLVQNQAEYPLAQTLRTCVHTFMEENANEPDKAAKSLYLFAMKMQLKAQEAEEKRLKDLKTLEKKQADAERNLEKQFGKMKEEEGRKVKIDNKPEGQ